MQYLNLMSHILIPLRRLSQCSLYQIYNRKPFFKSPACRHLLLLL